jgi:hypothetical protein
MINSELERREAGSGEKKGKHETGIVTRPMHRY